MRLLKITFFSLLLSLDIYGQDNDITIDSLRKYIRGNWDASILNCKNLQNDSIIRSIEITSEKFYLTETYDNRILRKLSGTFKIDSINTTGYVMTVTLDKESVKGKVNSLLLNILLNGPDRLHVTWLEMFYYKGEQKASHYIGEFKFYRTSEYTIGTDQNDNTN